jgi:hypothetical protein
MYNTAWSNNQSWVETYELQSTMKTNTQFRACLLAYFMCSFRENKIHYCHHNFLLQFLKTNTLVSSEFHDIHLMHCGFWVVQCHQRKIIDSIRIWNSGWDPYWHCCRESQSNVASKANALQSWLHKNCYSAA